MLVLSRKVGERILIGENISVTVVRISGGGVRLGIEAPAELPVVREELQQEINRINESSTPRLFHPDAESKPLTEGEKKT